MNKQLTSVPDDKAFWVNNGPVCHNLLELRDALRAMSNETFAHHVNRGKNDFVSWLRDVLGEEKLANDLKRVRTKATTLRRIENYLRL